mgnify:CR=1 FL=1
MATVAADQAALDLIAPAIPTITDDVAYSMTSLSCQADTTATGLEYWGVMVGLMAVDVEAYKTASEAYCTDASSAAASCFPASYATDYNGYVMVTRFFSARDTSNSDPLSNAIASGD